MTTADVEGLGRFAYEMYRSTTGNLLVPWNHQTPEMREVWRAVADAVRMRLESEWFGPHPLGGVDEEREKEWWMATAQCRTCSGTLKEDCGCGGGDKRCVCGGTGKVSCSTCSGTGREK